jgi:hypothetical protein
MRAIDAEALKKDLTRFYDNEVTAKRLIDEQPTIEPEQKTCKGCMWEDAYGYGNCPNCSRAYREDLYQPMT